VGRVQTGSDAGFGRSEAVAVTIQVPDVLSGTRRKVGDESTVMVVAFAEPDSPHTAASNIAALQTTKRDLIIVSPLAV
jgi:hypothetical protein